MVQLKTPQLLGLDGVTSDTVGAKGYDPGGGGLNVRGVNGAAGSVGSNMTGSTGGTFNISSTGAYTFAQGAAFDDLAIAHHNDFVGVHHG